MVLRIDVTMMHSILNYDLLTQELIINLVKTEEDFIVPHLVILCIADWYDYEAESLIC